jgi:hypothetical protein
MTGAELLDRLSRQGFTLAAEGRGIRVTPASRLSPVLRDAIRAYRDDLLSVLAGRWASLPGECASPPPGARLYFGDEDGRPCAPEDAHHWTWEGAPQWLYAARHPPPPHELALRPGYPKRCPRCVARRLRLSWQEFKGGTRHLRCDCGVCGRFVAHLTPPPKNPGVEYRATG